MSPIPSRPTPRLAALLAATCAVPLLVPTAPAAADVLYDSLASGTDGVAFFGDLVLEDLQVSGGGLLRTATVTVAADGSGGAPVLTDVGFSLAVDGGDGFPDLDGTGDDTFLFQTMMPGVAVPAGGSVEVTFDLAPFYALVPADALLFGGLQLSNPATGHLFHGAPTTGTTSPFVISFAAMGPVPAPGVSDPGLVNSMGLGFRLEADPLPPNPGGPGVVGDVIDFEGLGEGGQGPVLALGGATFSAARDGFPPPVDIPFALDDGTGVWDLNPDMLEFVGGTLLNAGGYSEGPDGYLFNALKSVRITPDQVRTGARLSVAYVAGYTDPPQSFADATITLLATLGGKPVASHTVFADNVLGGSGGGTFTFGASTLEISGVAFDDLVLFSNGGPSLGAMQMGLDDVVLGSAACTGDLDLSGDVGFDDLVVLLSAWGPCGGGDCDADLDGDGDVGFGDLVELLAGWGPCFG